MSLRTVVTEALQSVRASASTSLAATVTVLIGMFLLGVSIALGTWLLSWSHNLDHEIAVKVYFTRDATQQQEAAVINRVEPTRNALVKKVVYVSKGEAYQTMRKKYPDLFAAGAVPNNPFGDAVTIVPKQGKLAVQIRRSLMPLAPGVDSVKDGGKTAKRILSVGKIIWSVFLVMVLILLGASTLLIANTLRLSIFARRREIEVMKLVGASNWFVRGPFMLEGLLCGLAGSIAAVILLLLGKEVAIPAILGHIDRGSEAHALAFILNALILVAMGLMIGAAASGVTMRRFLRI